MPSIEQHYVLAAGTSIYPNFENSDLLSVPADIDSVADAFSSLGFTRILTTKSLNGPSREFRSTFNDWLHAPERSSKDRLVFYYSGHGEKTARHYLLFQNSRAGQFVETALAAESIIEMILESPVQQAWMNLDTCYSAAGIADATRLAGAMSKPE